MLRKLIERVTARWTGKKRSATPKKVRSPTVLQMEALECGAACLGIVLAYHGRWVPLEELRLACGVSRDGSKASNMVKAAMRYGLMPRPAKTEPAGLRRLQPPMILHWNFNHFVVLDGFRKGRVHLNDPASGPRTVSEEELDQSFTGVVLTFKPGSIFKRIGQPPRLLPALARRLIGSQAALVFVLLAGLALVVPGLVTPVFTKVFIDQVLLRNHREWLGPLLVGMGVTAAMIGALTWIQQSYLLRLETKMALAASGRFLRHVLRLPVEFFTQRFAGDISNRVSANDRVAQLLSRDLATNVLGAVMVVFFATLMFRYDALLTLIGIVVVSMNVAALQFVSRKRVDGNRSLLQEQGKLHGTAIGGLQIIETLKATAGESDLFSRWAGYQAKVVNIRQDVERYTQLLDAVPPLLAAVNTALILGIGSLRVMNGVLTLGGLVAFQALMASFIAPVNRLVTLGAKLQTVEGDMNRLDDVLRYPPEAGIESEAGEPPSPESAVKLAGHLELREVSFGYSRLAPPLIEGLSLTLKPASRVALVGGSGSGKSTVAKLIVGLYEPWSGEILFDGRPRLEVPRSVMTNSLASVDQSVFLFEGSVRDNLTLWDSTVPLPEVVAAAKDAAIHEDVAARPDGYDSLVDEGGANFSGGQRQRLEIARALVTRPSILVLDEATSALDPATEQLIDEDLRRRGSTCVIVAHRLSTIRDADEIIVLEEGKVVQRGTHDEMKNAEGPYAQLIASH
ncbi:MAG: NHLP family bacteriocin export ABC transporter peptidase/permease/ATPase subunit [bacterium]|nr:NHLP family bacteriocin export ABC transporter peptidase/permease/ATPase subunit [bacterium]